MSVLATCLGFPRIGAARELKKALEGFWSKQLSAEELQDAAAQLRQRHWLVMKTAGIDHIPVGDFSLYDHMLDLAVMLGAVPSRYRGISDPLMRYFAMARGLQDPARGIDLPALEMTKWFDTNYHYIVPELEAEQRFVLDSSRLLAEIREARALGIEPRPVVPGPLTFLLLSKLAPGAKEGASTLDLLDQLLPVYEQLLAQLADEKIAWLQLDEPCLVLDLAEREQAAYRKALQYLTMLGRRPKLLVATYFGAPLGNLELAVGAGVDGIHIDLVRALAQFDGVLSRLKKDTVLSVGVIDGRNVWRADLDAAHRLVKHAVHVLGAQRVWVGPSCSLLHVPVDLSREEKLDAELKSWLAFAEQKLGEIRALASAGGDDARKGPAFAEARAARDSRRDSARTKNPDVRQRVASIQEADLQRHSVFGARAPEQQARFGLPPLPTTTIGSFPQTSNVRAARASWRAGRLTAQEYQAYLEQETRSCIERQEALDLDVLVHGEFERTDMVEYFGEKLAGFAFTANGWVQSYGSRCVKPPIIYGDVWRPEPMTVAWSRYAQSLTEKPVKGMLTGPVTILQWSFVRDDQPRNETCRQIALALRDEVRDLEAADIRMVQVDEPAIREGLPLRKADWSWYLRWAVDAFRLATSGVRDETQIHTHMCYSEFGDILPSIAEMDADVLSIETSRSRMELLGDFARFRYPNEIGPGVYDIHSPRVPTSSEMIDLLETALGVIPAERLWVNPDCGLKTRGWPEVESALAAMVDAAKQVRKTLR